MRNQQNGLPGRRVQSTNGHVYRVGIVVDGGPRGLQVHSAKGNALLLEATQPWVPQTTVANKTMNQQHGGFVRYRVQGRVREPLRAKWLLPAKHQGRCDDFLPPRAEHLKDRGPWRRVVTVLLVHPYKLHGQYGGIPQQRQRRAGGRPQWVAL